MYARDRNAREPEYARELGAEERYGRGQQVNRA
jgi:hypothetical protein